MLPTCFKESIIVPVLKKPHPASPNDYRPKGFTSVVVPSTMKRYDLHTPDLKYMYMKVYVGICINSVFLYAYTVRNLGFSVMP